MQDLAGVAHDYNYINCQLYFIASYNNSDRVLFTNSLVHARITKCDIICTTLHRNLIH